VGLAVLVLGGVLLGDVGNADAKVTRVERRRDGTIVKIYDDEVREAIEEEGKIGAYLQPIKFCNIHNKNHVDINRRKVELGFQTRSGRIVDYLPQIRRPQSEIYPQPTPQEVRDFDNEQKDARISKGIEEWKKELETNPQYKK
jgi:hypothetical protein